MQSGQHANRVKRLEKEVDDGQEIKRELLISTYATTATPQSEYVQEHYFHYDAKKATDALSTGRGQLKAATGTDWMRDLYVQVS